MKGLFNKALVIALLASVSGISAQRESKDIVAEAIIGGSIGYTLASLIDTLRDSNSALNKTMCAAGSALLQGARHASSAVVNGVSVVSEKAAPVVAKQADVLKLAANRIASDMKYFVDAEVRGLKTAGSAVKAGAVKAVELSKPALAASLGYAARAKDGAMSFYSNYTEVCQLSAFLMGYVGIVYYANHLEQEYFAAKAKQVTEATQVDVDELTTQVIA